MIYTVTLNPSLDYYVKVVPYHTGAVNRAESAELRPGGKGINVSFVLKNLGIDSTALGFIAGFTGTEIERLLNEAGISTDFVKLEHGNSRINIKLRTESETEINASGPHITDLEKLYAKLDRLQDGDFLVLAGSVPVGLPDTTYRDIIQKISDRDIKVVVDAEGGLLMNTLEYKPFMIKPNHHELGAIFGKNLNSREEVAECAVILRERGARNVFVTMAGDGGVLAAQDGSVLFGTAPEGKVINSTGAGDSTVAGFIAGIVGKEATEQAFIRGICTGSASAFSQGFADRAAVEALIDKMR